MPAAKGTAPWNKGTSQGWTDKRGYRWLYVDENGRRRARREHRVLVERSIGRRLEPWEIVHHKDGNPSNNAIDNLEVMEFGVHSSEHHTGSRRDADARRSMEAFALLREELKAERAVKSELLEALRHIEGAAMDMRCERAVIRDAARAAIAKATGEAA